MASGPCFDSDLHIETDLQRGQECANVKVKAHLFSKQDKSELVRWLAIDQSMKAAIAQTESTVMLPSGGLEYTAEASVSNQKIWSTWDRGQPNLYLARMDFPGNICAFTIHD